MSYARTMDMFDGRKIPSGPIVLSRDMRTHIPDVSDDSDCFTSSSLVSSASTGSINSSLSRYVGSPHGKPRPVPATGTPNWYIRKIHEQTVSTKQLAALQNVLQGKDTEWIRQFVQLDGMAILARWLYYSNRKSSDVDVEFEVVKCLTYILNHRPATEIALANGAKDIVTHIASALDTTHLPTRRFLLDILVFLVYWNDGESYPLVVQGLQSLSEDNDEPGNCYAFWFKSLKAVLAGRGKMGSKVGASESFKRNGGEPDGALTEYLLSNFLLMNGIMQAIDDLEVRLHHRSIMEASGLADILNLARKCAIPIIDKQLELLEQNIDEDEHHLEENMQRIDSCDFNSVDDVYRALREKLKGSKGEGYLLSIMQHLLLIRQDGSELVHHLQVVDSVVMDVVMDKKLGGAEKRLGLSVERIVEQLNQVERSQGMEQDLINARSTALNLKLEKEIMEDRLEHAEQLIVALQQELCRLRPEKPLSKKDDTPYKERLAQLADAIPGSPLPLSYVMTNTPSIKSPQTTAGKPFWGLSWFGANASANGTPVDAGLGFSVIAKENYAQSEKT